MNKDNMYIEKLVSKAASGDQCAWSDLYNKTFRDAYFVAIKITNNEDNAIELVHDAFITAFDKVNQLDDKSKFQSWFNMIVANKCRDFLRKRKPVLFSDMETEDGILPDWEDERDDSRPEEIIDRQETVRLIAEIIESLPEDQKLCIMMYYWNEFSVSEIASSLEVSEGTVKSRLNYARIKIKAKVEELEKKGTKLYGLAPIPLLVWLLKSEASAMTVPASATLAPAIVSANVAATTTATGAVSATNAAVGTVTKTIMSGITGKIVAGVAALSLVLGGAGIYNHIQNKDDSNLTDSAYALYEELLSKGVTDNGLKITHYAYLDLNDDEIPELLVSSADGTPDSWSKCEIYTYRDDSIYNCGETDSRYDYFYYVNEKYVLGRDRMGNQFVNVDEFIQTTLYKWDKSTTRNDPAISYNGGDWEYITEEEFEFYQTMPDDENVANRFIQSATPISLKKNAFLNSNLIEKYLSYTDDWYFYATSGHEYNDMFIVSMTFKENGKIDCIISAAGRISNNEYYATEALSCHEYSYTADDEILSICDESDEECYVYRFNPDTYEIVQISKKGFFLNHVEGDTFTLIKNEGEIKSNQELKEILEQNFTEYDDSPYIDY